VNPEERPGPARSRVAVDVTQEHHIAQAQRAARSVARSLGLGEAATYSIATAVSELANNLFFHAHRGGTITIAALRRNGRVGVEVVAEDKGPGIADVEAAMRDGFTTNRGMGAGLPGVERLMDELEITSAPGRGTRVVARKWESMQNEK